MDEFIQYLYEVFAEFGQVQIKPMFGGKGVFYEGVMIGLVFDKVLYLKADKLTASAYTDRGLSAFQYQKKDKQISLSFYQAPEEALEDPAEMVSWASQAFDVALKNKKPATVKEL